MPHHATYEAFGGDASLIKAYEHWSVLIRPKQATLGAMVLVAHADVTSYGALPAEAYAELAAVVPDIEAALAKTFSPQKMNYLMLMMVDPHVHYHVLPRYEAAKAFEGVEVTDTGWPGPPDLKNQTPEHVANAAREVLMGAWPKG
ncbi:HIT family protein [Parvularcula maris]|uniref:HIT family protein n=1 Tax=Parvularcula maris TaxID=2965077 RepID=A0A9X2LAY3_9PROT|nr:HIT family protein [Parvularcula maris]MCQ8186327.1 HIT family protein [Parvularcula maris]